MKKILGIYGSPRQNGNSDILLSNALQGAEANGSVVEKVIIRELQIAPCNSCGGCYENGVCVIGDKMQEMYTKLVNANVIVVSSPIYFMSVSAQLKAFIDRCQALWVRKYILHKSIRDDGRFAKGFFIATAARNPVENLFTGAIQTIKAFFHVSDTQYTGNILCAGVEEKGAVSKKQELLRQAFDAGKNLTI